MYPNEELPKVFLKPGEMYFAEKPLLISTILGSCITVTMFCRRCGKGAMCHGLLPYYKKSHKAGKETNRFRYVDWSIHQMLERFLKGSATKTDIEVKIFGGAEIAKTSKNDDSLQSVGEKNIEAAFETLKKLGLKAAKKDIGGESGRKIFFNTFTGDVYLKRIKT